MEKEDVVEYFPCNNCKNTKYYKTPGDLVCSHCHVCVENYIELENDQKLELARYEDELANQQEKKEVYPPLVNSIHLKILLGCANLFVFSGFLESHFSTAD